MRARIAGLAVACAASAAIAAPAQAAFAPELLVSLEPPTAGSEPAVTATISQPASETAVRRFTLTLPAGFTATGARAASACPIASIRIGTCPASSRIGEVDATVGATLGFSGTIHKASPNSFVLLVSGLGGSIRQTVPGVLRKRDSGALDLTIDQLPALAFSKLSIRFDGGARSLVRAPKRCGTYAIDGKFTSRGDDLALARSLLAITGCAGVPAIPVTNLRMSRKRFKAGRQTIVAWSAARAADHTNVRIERKRKGRWRVLGVLIATGKAGENILRWDGRIGGRALKAGRYGVRVQPAGSAPSRLLRFKIRKR